MTAETSPQVSLFGKVTNLASKNFKLSQNAPFLIKNDNADEVILEVMPRHGTAFVSTKFAPGWNPEIVTEIKKASAKGDLLWGF